VESKAWRSGPLRISRVVGDLTRDRADAIVNAANTALSGGGGVDGAIHAAAGPELAIACSAFPEVVEGIRCPVGSARVTLGFDLTCRWVIHTVGPVWRDPESDRESLISAFRSSIRLADALGSRSLAMPAISCGVYGCPHREAALAAAKAIELESYNLIRLRNLRFVLVSESVALQWDDVFMSQSWDLLDLL